MRYWLLSLCLAIVPAPALAQNSQEAIARRLRPYAAEWERLVAAEDARAATPAQLQVLMKAARSPQTELRRLAVRGLGRLERASLVDSIAPLLRDPVAAVRAEAAHALGQAVVRDSMAYIGSRLLEAFQRERNAEVVAALAETLGRARYRETGTPRTVLHALLPLLSRDPVVKLGAARGLFFLTRQPAARPTIDDAARTALLQTATATAAAQDVRARRTRTAAAAALAQAGGMTAATIDRLLNTDEAAVRREAAVALVALADTVAGRPLVMRALNDSAAAVRYDALRAYGRRYGARGCDPILRATQDANAHVVLQAIDLLGTACPGNAEAAARLQLLAAQDIASPRWHAPAHALVALARSAPESARPQLPRFAANPNLFVQMYAAMAAGLLRDAGTLRQLASDRDPNVRTAALEELNKLVGHGADSIYIASLNSDDSQVLMAAAAGLEGSSDAQAPVALLDALDRVSALKSETSRDGRVALLQRVQQLGSATLAARLRPYLRDFDPRMANLAADILGAWTGTRPVPEPTAPPPLPRPTFAQAAELASATVVIELAEGNVELRLLPFDAPTNAFRFARLSRAGYFNGLTLHRVAPNFVVQGGSPNANEYSGDKPFSRDELGAFNWRGTVGLSTRGRDTGDAQIYFNLIDNVRLDHDYTVLAEVVRGMDVVDRLLEGAIMRRVYVRKN